MRSPADGLAELDARQLRSTLRIFESARGPAVAIDGQENLNFSSNNYPVQLPIRN